MTRYFMHLRDGTDVALDEEGREFGDEASLFGAMLHSARDTMTGDVREGRLDLRLRIDAETADGRVVRSLPFVDALEITYPEPEPTRQSASGN
jgi:hypothetical protein